MEKDFDSRALLKSLGTYAPKKKQHSKAMQRLLATDPLDPALEDRLHAVLEEVGEDICRAPAGALQISATFLMPTSAESEREVA